MTLIYSLIDPAWEPVRKLDLGLLGNKKVRYKADRLMQCSALHVKSNTADCFFYCPTLRADTIFIHIFVFRHYRYPISFLPHALICIKISVCRPEPSFRTGSYTTFNSFRFLKSSSTISSGVPSIILTS